MLQDVGLDSGTNVEIDELVGRLQVGIVEHGTLQFGLFRYLTVVVEYQEEQAQEDGVEDKSDQQKEQRAQESCL